MEICVENLQSKKVEKLTPKMVRRLLGIDNKEIADLCRQISLIPKRDEKGQTYFSKEDVDVLQKIKQLHASSAASVPINNVVNYKPQAIQKIPDSYTVTTENPEAQNIINAFAGIEKKLIGRIAKVIDEKLDGMDEVVVELIRCKTENESLRQKINELNKLVYSLKNESNSYKPIGFNLYFRQNSDFAE